MCASKKRGVRIPNKFEKGRSSGAQVQVQLMGTVGPQRPKGAMTFQGLPRGHHQGLLFKGTYSIRSPLNPKSCLIVALKLLINNGIPDTKGDRGLQFFSATPYRSLGVLEQLLVSPSFPSLATLPPPESIVLQTSLGVLGRSGGHFDCKL